MCAFPVGAPVKKKGYYGKAERFRVLVLYREVNGRVDVAITAIEEKGEPEAIEALFVESKVDDGQNVIVNPLVLSGTVKEKRYHRKIYDQI